MSMSDEKQKASSPEPDVEAVQEPDRSVLSRRKFLATLGITGAATLLGAAGPLNGAPLKESSVSDAVYGKGPNGPRLTSLTTSTYVETISSAAQLTGYQGGWDGQQVFVQGFYPGGTAGYGLFYYDADRAKSEHNGGTIISWTVPWDGTTASLSSFLSGAGETDPTGQGCWIRQHNPHEVYAEWFGVIGNNGDETAAFLAAKQAAEASPCIRLYLPAEIVTITLNSPLFFSKQGFGLHGTGVDPHLYSANEDHVSGLRMNGGTAGETYQAALIFDGIGQSASDFVLIAGTSCNWYWPLDTCTYSGDFQRIRSRGFNGGQRLYNSPTYGHEAIANKFERLEMYAVRRGLQLGRNPVTGAVQGACNENTWINCRYRGYEVILDLYRNTTPRSYGNVFMNCIFQERAPVGEGDFELLKTEGSNVEGVTFINGRFECTLEAGRKRPVLNLNGVSSKSLCTFIGTYIHTSITILDTNNRLRSLGTVLNPNWTADAIEANSLLARGTTEMVNKMNTSNSLRWSGTGAVTTPTRHWVESPYIANGQTSVGYGGKYRKGTFWAENVIEYTASSSTTRETKVWVDGVPMTRTVLEGSGKLYVPASDGDTMLGSSTARWSDVYSVNGVINTSDRNQKQDIQPITDRVLDAWADMQYQMFRFKEAVREKGDAARWHIGLVAQDIYDTFKRHGLDALAYGLVCVDEKVDEKTGKREQVWGIRSDECQFLEMALVRRELNKLKA
ncbi:tail fiber domain-containing protein [Paenibacillus sp. NPDC056579]|uniref:tail fiber domain-containing protein n=1 Tax=Paenibacillus sp. NPDC056579 TaxID=3345871 RepID=UPI0036A0AF3F